MKKIKKLKKNIELNRVKNFMLNHGIKKIQKKKREKIFFYQIMELMSKLNYTINI